MRVINIIDSVSPINYGIWNSIIVNFEHLESRDIMSEIWFPETANSIAAKYVEEIGDTSIRFLNELVIQKRLDPENDIIVTHGAWNYPTRWGNHLQKKGFKWVYVPHGMLEPWPLRQKWLKKKIYFTLFEKKMALKADMIRAVSRPEFANLVQIFDEKKIQCLPNAVDTDSMSIPALNNKLTAITRYLFLSRLHHKKNIVALAKAWNSSKLSGNPLFELVIAGPDQGELVHLQPSLAACSNMKYVGAVHGAEKQMLFANSSFYVLPSFSEGLPSALLEAMAHQLIPIITEGCNFPDVFENDLGVKISTDEHDIRAALERTSNWDRSEIDEKGNRNRDLIIKEYSLATMAERQIRLYHLLMNSK